MPATVPFKHWLGNALLLHNSSKAPALVGDGSGGWLKYVHESSEHQAGTPAPKVAPRGSKYLRTQDVGLQPFQLELNSNS